jgi:agmatinase
LNRGATPIILGGDHSISYPAIRAFDQFEPLTIVLIDAHLDYRDRFLGLPFTNNSPFRRARELPFVREIISFGIRGIKSTDREYRESLDHGNRIFTNYEIFDRGVEQLLTSLPNALGNYYLSIDIDGLDPSIAPGTETPEAEGLTFRQAKQIVRGLGMRGNLVGFDLVEVNPYLDHSEVTAHIAVQLLLEAAATAVTGGRQLPELRTNSG